jgi:hypothetical protein
LNIKQYSYFLYIIDLAAELCLGRNGNSVDHLQEMYSFDTIKIIIKDGLLPYELRAMWIKILLNMHMNREPLEAIQVPSQTGIWNELPQFVKESFMDPANITYQIKQSKISVPSSLSTIKKFVEQYLYDT